nr:MAG TPA: hypothetical protein [Caudoviricetes sp.]
MLIDTKNPDSFLTQTFYSGSALLDRSIEATIGFLEQNLPAFLSNLSQLW